MVTTTETNAPAAPLLEISLHWPDDRLPVVALVDERGAKRLVARLAFADPDRLEAAIAGASSEPARLLLGVLAYCRHLLDRGGCLALVDVRGARLVLPARSVRAIDVRLVAPRSRARTSHDPVGLRSAFCPGPSQEPEPC